MVRVTFTSPELGALRLERAGCAHQAHFRAARGGRCVGRRGARPTTRTYTPRRFDGAARELDVDFILHGEGPASAWAEQATLGQTLTIAGPGRSYAIDPRRRVVSARG